MARITGKKIGTRAEREKRDQIIIELYKKGLPPKKIGELLEVSSSTVGQIVRRNGVPAQNEAASIAGKKGAEIAAAKKNAQANPSVSNPYLNSYKEMIKSIIKFLKELAEIFGFTAELDIMFEEVFKDEKH